MARGTWRPSDVWTGSGMVSRAPNAEEAALGHTSSEAGAGPHPDHRACDAPAPLQSSPGTVRGHCRALRGRGLQRRGGSVEGEGRGAALASGSGRVLPSPRGHPSHQTPLARPFWVTKRLKRQHGVQPQLLSHSCAAQWVPRRRGGRTLSGHRGLGPGDPFRRRLRAVSLTQASRSPQKLDTALASSEGARPCLYLYFRLPASRTVREEIPVV